MDLDLELMQVEINTRTQLFHISRDVVIWPNQDRASILRCNWSERKSPTKAKNTLNETIECCADRTGHPLNNIRSVGGQMRQYVSQISQFSLVARDSGVG